MRKKLEIMRQEGPDTASYVQTVIYETDDDHATVATALREQENWRMEDGTPYRERPVRWECSCLQKKCGACAMRINGLPRLACDTKLAECKGDTVKLEPLKKFPVICDLITDRSVLMENLKALSVWLNDTAEHKESGNDLAYEGSRCLQCGCCLEVCPNFLAGGPFAGMAVMVPFTRIIAQIPEAQKKEIAKNYQDGVYNGCGKSLACHTVCPAGIDIEKLMVNSNSAAVWKRWLKKGSLVLSRERKA